MDRVLTAKVGRAAPKPLLSVCDTDPNADVLISEARMEFIAQCRKEGREIPQFEITMRKTAHDDAEK